MNSLIGIVLLGVLSLFIMLFPLWQRRADKSLGTGIESDDLAIQWELEKDRLVKEQHDLDLALAEGKISENTHLAEREQVMVDAKRALSRLRQVRQVSKQEVAGEKHKPRSYPAYGAILATFVLIGTLALTLHFKGQDINRSVQTAKAGSEIKMADIENMVASLEKRVKKGEGTVRDQLMLARSYLVLGKKQQSIELYQKIHSDDVGNIVPIMALGEIFFNSKDKAQQNRADDYFDKALVLEPQQPQALWFKSLGLVRARKFEEARDYLARLKVAAKDNEKAQNAVSRLLAELDKTLAANKKAKTSNEKAPDEKISKEKSQSK